MAGRVRYAAVGVAVLMLGSVGLVSPASAQVPNTDVLTGAGTVTYSLNASSTSLTGAIAGTSANGEFQLSINQYNGNCNAGLTITAGTIFLGLYSAVCTQVYNSLVGSTYEFSPAPFSSYFTGTLNVVDVASLQPAPYGSELIAVAGQVSVFPYVG